jgi:chemotaxis protein methyltransferase CheR
MRDKLERLTEVDFNKLSKLINTNYGIKLPISKKLMIEGRLRKRLKANSIDTFNEYVEYVFSDIGIKKELVHMIDVVSTNKTDFFREPTHFDYLTEEILPKFLKEKSGKTLKIWSSACSTGEEPYTIAIVIEEFLKGIRSFDYTIHCTDISTQVLKKAVDGIYNLERIEKIPIEIKRKYFLKSKDPQKNIVRIIPELRKKLTVRRLNLIDDLYKTPHDFDIIFCRNVLIYFDKPTQESVINKLSKKLLTGGIFFLGHSESLTGIKAPLKSLKPTTFVKT